MAKVVFFLAIAVVNLLLYRYFSLTLPIHIDPVDYTYPFLQLIKTRLLQGESVLWSPEIYGGIPLLFSGSLDLKIIPLLMVLDTAEAIVLYGGLITGAGALSFYYMAKAFQASHFSALITAIIWAYNPYQLNYIYDHVYATINMWLPVVVYCLKKQPNFSVPLLSIAFIDQIATARIQTLEITAIILIIYILTELHQGKNWFVKNVKNLAGALSISVLVLAPFLYTFITTLLSSHRFSSMTPSLVEPLNSAFIYFTPIGILVLGGLRKASYILAAGVFAGLYYNIFDFFEFYKNIPFHEGIRYSRRFAPGIYFFLLLALLVGLQRQNKVICLLGMAGSFYLGLLEPGASAILYYGFTLLFCYLSLGLPQAKIASATAALLLLTLLAQSNYGKHQLLQKTYQNQEFNSITNYLSQLDPENKYRFLSESIPEYGFEGPTLAANLLAAGKYSAAGYYVFPSREYSTRLAQGGGRVHGKYYQDYGKPPPVEAWQRHNIRFYLGSVNGFGSKLITDPRVKLHYQSLQGLQVFEILDTKASFYWEDQQGELSVSEEPTKITMEVKRETPGYLIATKNLEQWKLSLDGKSHATGSRVYVPAGVHTLIWNYRLPDMLWGLSLLGVLIWLFCLYRSRIQKSIT